MTFLLLIRHGETDWNAQNRVQGWSNSLLSVRGNSQASRLASRLESVELDALYSSDLTRALQTAAPIAESHDLETRPDSRLREIGYGDWEGLTGDEIRQRFPDVWRRRQSHFSETDAPNGGESWLDVNIRMTAFLGEILAAHSGDSSVAVVGHGGSLRILLLHILDLPLSHIRRFHLDNASVSRLEFSVDGEENRVWSVNDTGHLL